MDLQLLKVSKIHQLMFDITFFLSITVNDVMDLVSFDATDLLVYSSDQTGSLLNNDMQYKEECLDLSF